MRTIISISFLFLTLIGCNAQNNSIVGVWNRGFQPKTETLTRIPDSLTSKPLYSIENITFNKNGTFLHKRNPPCGNDVFFIKKGTYSLYNKELILKYNGGETYYDYYNNNKETLTKKEVLTYIFTRLNDNTITIEDKYFEKKTALKTEEQQNLIRVNGLKSAEKFGFIKGTIKGEFIWFPSYEITDAWFAQIENLIKREPQSKVFNITSLNNTEYLSNYIFNETLPIATEPTTYLSNHITLIEGKTLKQQIKFRIQKKLNTNYKSYESSTKTKFKNIKIKDGFISGKIKGKLVESFNEKEMIPVNIKFKIKLCEYKQVKK